MSKSHIEKLEKELRLSKWVIVLEDNTENFIWKISRPNGDSLMTIDFSVYGNNFFGELEGNETLHNAIGCHIKNHPEINLYFGKYSGQFQKDVVEFVNQLNSIDFKNS
jgi:hypothetical protein